MKCVVVIVSRRPVVVEQFVPAVDALIAAWLPGNEGQGVADVLFGDYGFNGKLPRTWFRTVDQLPWMLEIRNMTRYTRLVLYWQLSPPVSRENNSLRYYKFYFYFYFCSFSFFSVTFKKKNFVSFSSMDFLKKNSFSTSDRHLVMVLKKNPQLISCRYARITMPKYHKNYSYQWTFYQQLKSSRFFYFVIYPFLKKFSKQKSWAMEFILWQQQ